MLYKARLSTFESGVENLNSDHDPNACFLCNLLTSQVANMLLTNYRSLF